MEERIKPDMELEFLEEDEHDFLMKEGGEGGLNCAKKSKRVFSRKKKIQLLVIVGIMALGFFVLLQARVDVMSQYKSVCDGLFGVNNSDVLCDEGGVCKCVPVDCTKVAGSVSSLDCFKILNDGVNL